MRNTNPSFFSNKNEKRKGDKERKREWEWVSGEEGGVRGGGG